MVTKRLTPNGKPDDNSPGRIIVPSGGQVIAAPEKFQRLFDEAQAMEREDAWQSGEVGFLSRASVQVTLPYRAPKGAPPVWTRSSGNISLMIQPGYFTQQRSERASNGRQRIVSETVSFGYPYGSYPRLMLAWIGKEIMAKKKRGEFQGTVEDRRISLGNSLSEFMYNLGIPMATGGKRGTMTLVRQQMIRLFSATIAIVQNKSAPSSQNQNQEPLSIDRIGYLLADQLSTWWDPMQPGQGSMFESFVVLSEPFFNELVNRPVPVDMRALKALKQSPFALDVYSWLTYRFFTIQKRTEIPLGSAADAIRYRNGKRAEIPCVVPQGAEGRAGCLSGRQGGCRLFQGADSAAFAYERTEVGLKSARSARQRKGSRSSPFSSQAISPKLIPA